MNNTQELMELLRRVRDGAVSPEDAALALRKSPFEDLGYAKVDLHRGIRQGAAEVIYGEGKTVDQILGILHTLSEHDCANILVTRIDAGTAEALQAAGIPLRYHAQARLGIAYEKAIPLVGSVVVATGGTSDLPVAEEAALTAEALGSRVVRLYDVGVSGLHRLLANLDPLMRARVCIVVAGMEGALATVVGGLVDCPLIAVPTSVGYGANFNGLSALLSMLNSCASGSSVVNIDNGFGAGFLANRINQMKGPED